MYYLYELVDPRTNEVRYVGVSKKPKEHYTHSLMDTDHNPGRTAWIGELLREGLRPTMLIRAEITDRSTALSQKRCWVTIYLKQGRNLLNIHKPSPKDTIEPIELNLALDVADLPDDTPSIIEDSQRPVYVYELRDPDTNEVRYVGRSKSLKTRISSHMCSAKRNIHHNSGMNKWLNGLIKQGKSPTITIARTTSQELQEDHERYHIHMLIGHGCALLNEVTYYTLSKNLIEMTVNKRVSYVVAPTSLFLYAYYGEEGRKDALWISQTDNVAKIAMYNLRKDRVEIKAARVDKLRERTEESPIDPVLQRAVEMQEAVSIHKSLIPIEQRFWKHVNKQGGDQCWLWTGYIENGYGKISKDATNERYSAHKLSYELSFGPIPSRLYVQHKCGVRACVRPEHLFLSPYKRSELDMSRKRSKRSKLTITSEQ